MARTNLPLSKLVANSHLTDPAGTAIDQANGMNVALASTAIPSQAGGASLVLRVANTNGSNRVVTIKAGAALDTGNPPAFRQSLGDLAVTVAATTGVEWIGPFDTSRFIQKDGSINIDFAASFAGTITAFLLPKNTGN